MFPAYGGSFHKGVGILINLAKAGLICGKISAQFIRFKVPQPPDGRAKRRSR